MRKGCIQASPFWRIRLDFGRQRLLPRNLAATDAKRMIEQGWRQIDLSSSNPGGPRDPRFRSLRNLAILEVLFATGMRVGELVSLTLADWRKEESSFLVMGKGLRQRIAILPDERSQRAVRMYIDSRLRLSVDHEALFVNPRGKRISSQGIVRVIASTARAAGLGVRVTPHMIRHTVGTLLLRCGADIRVVQEVLGHASIVTTQRYTFVSQDHIMSTLRTNHPNHQMKIQLPPPTGVI